MAQKEPHPLIRRWEGLEFGLQFIIAYPTLIVLVALLHVTALAQPPMRGFIYGLFWALPAAFLVVIASQNEARKRRERAREAAGESDADAS